MGSTGRSHAASERKTLPELSAALDEGAGVDAAYREARRLAYGQSIARLQQAASAASSTLLKIMIDPNSPPSCRLRAADSVLSHAAKAIEIEDIEARVTALEQTAAQAHQKR